MLPPVKEDVLEQVVEDYLNFQGYFTIHNVPFHPDKSHPEYRATEDSVPSDIDVIGINPRKKGIDRVIAVTCKSWQGGFHAERLLAQLREERPNPKRATWRHFRELWKPKWSGAFREQIEERTGAQRFAYRVAVTKLKGDPSGWGSEETIARNLPGCSFGFLEMEKMWEEILDKLTERPAASELGRLAQLLKAAGVTPR
jgi:hypothetical protein